MSAHQKRDLADVPLDRERIGALFADLAGSAWVTMGMLQKMISDDDCEGASGIAAIVAQMGALADISAEFFGQIPVYERAESWTFSPRAIESLDALRGVRQADGGEA